ncbi:MAG: KR domain-containing protein, partial [Flavobacteriales bacterium]|nr:KR domain-containing protein [Flavobacteriales bacterium]
HCIAADVSDKQNLLEQLEVFNDRIPQIKGIIHTAGVGDYAGLIQRRTKEDDAAIFTPKIQGTDTLVQLFAGENLDFFVNCSSLAASMGPLGQVGYVAANLYQDACAEQMNGNAPVISIQWTSLKDVGMTVEATKDFSEGDLDSVFEYAISPEEAIKVLERALFLKVPTQIISTNDFVKMFENSDAGLELLDDLDEDVYLENIAKRERPDLVTEFVEASTETEIGLREIFEKFFGMDRVGIQDDFCELGGDSLKAMVVLRKIAKVFEVEMTIKEFLENRNIEVLANLIDEQMWMNKETDKKFTEVI